MDFLNHPDQIRLLNAYKRTRAAHQWDTAARPFATLGCRVSGSCTFFSHGESCTVHAPDTIYIPPGVSYHQEAEDETLYVLHFSIPEPVDRSIRVLSHAFGDCRQTFSEIIAAFSQGTPEGSFRAQALFFHFLARLAAFYGEKKDTRLAHALAYMQSHFADPALTIEAVAAQVYVSPVFLRRLFKAQLGCTPIKALVSLRMDAARRLLIEGDLPIAVIAAQCGFSEAKYFSKVFHDATGVTARRYRELYR